MPRLLRMLIVLALLLAALPGAALAHPSGGGDANRVEISYEEDFPGEGVRFEKQHPGNHGHLEPRNDNVTLIGKARMTPKVELEEEEDTGDPGPEPPEAPVEPDRDALTGRIADVAAYADHAYLAAFREPVCDGGGVFVVDISDPANPVEVEDAFIPAQPANYVGEGMQVIAVETATFSGPVLVHNNEICDYDVAPLDSGGISLWDVSDPTAPEAIYENFADSTFFGEGEDDFYNHEYHSMRAWEQDGRYYVVGVDNDEGGVTDIDIFDITETLLSSGAVAPELIAETGLPDFEEAEETPPPNGNTSFHHDVMHYVTQGESRLLVSYWDAGYVWLNVDDPADPQFVSDTDFGPVEPFLDELDTDEELTPEGNAHQAELSPDGSLFIGADEDFNPYRIIAEVTSGHFAGEEFAATQAGPTPITADRSVSGEVVFVGFGCNTPATTDGPSSIEPAEQEGQIALISRGGPPGEEACSFNEKLENAQEAGYAAAIVMNNVRADCLSLVNMLVDIDLQIPALFVNRSTGLMILDVEHEDACTTPSPEIGTTGAVDIRAVFDGWGYVHLYDAVTMEELDVYAIEESLDQAFADDFGDLSVHEVAMDPNRPGRAYLAYYSGGFRVIEYSAEEGITEVGAFIDEDGNNFWGVEYHVLPDGQELVLASDRDYGLYIFNPAASATRLRGAGRIETAIAVSQDSFGDDEADTVVLARADDFADALAGTPLAVAANAPLLLTPSNRLDALTAAEIQRVLPDGATVHVLGGEAAISSAVVDALEDLGFEVERIFGTTRIETSVEIAEFLGETDTLLVTRAFEFPDALTAGAAAGHVGGAVLLTTDDRPHPAVDDYLASAEDADVFAVGGPAAAAYPEATPIVGSTRVETGVAVAEAFFDAPLVAGIARSDQFPDALSGGAHIARLGGPMLLTPPASLHPAVEGYLCGEPIRSTYVYGGTAAISEATFASVIGAVQGTACGDDTDD
jgi:hypothetical protein